MKLTGVGSRAVVRRGLPLLAVAVGLAVLASQARTAPQPSEVPITWELQIDYSQPPLPIQFRPPGSDHEQTYWYFLFTITNPTDEDQTFIPNFVLYTDTGQVLRAGMGIPPGLFERIKVNYNDPLLSRLKDVTGRLLQGEDNARHSVAIFRDIDPNAGSFDLFLGGLSGERATVPLTNPITVMKIKPDGNMVAVPTYEATVEKTLQLHYELPGQAKSRLLIRPKLDTRRWVMR